MSRVNSPISIPKSNRVAAPAVFFANRNDEINTVVNVLTGGVSGSTPEKRCVIRGNSGIGKTELCRAVAHQLVPEYPDAQIYIKAKEHEFG